MLSRREFRLPVDLVNFLAKLGVARNEILCKCNCICNPFYCNLMIFCECICSIEVFAESIVRAKCFCGTNNTELPVGDVRRRRGSAWDATSSQQVFVTHVVVRCAAKHSQTHAHRNAQTDMMYTVDAATPVCGGFVLGGLWVKHFLGFC